MTDRDLPARDRHFVLGISGGSGAPYALRLLEVLLTAGARLDVVVSDAGRRVLQHETGVVGADEVLAKRHLAPPELHDRLVLYDLAAVESTPASGSARIDAVVLCPCSMGSVARVAHGFSTNLLERAADVALKEGRRLIVVPRETPLSAIHLRNLLRLVECGAIVLPAMPGFYHRPASVGDMIDFVVARIVDKLGIDLELVRRWRTPETAAGDAASNPWFEGEAPE